MTTLKYSVIKSDNQYYQYCDKLEQLIETGKSVDLTEEIELLTLLIRDFDDRYSLFRDKDPIDFLKLLMQDNQLRQKDLADIADVGKSYISEILHYKKSMSKKVIRRLSEHFKVSQKAFNRPYKLDKSLAVSQG